LILAKLTLQSQEGHRRVSLGFGSAILVLVC
jgi:hypothetical protein